VGALIDPLAKLLYLHRGKAFSFGGHTFILVRGVHALEQQAGIRVSGNPCRAGVAAFLGLGAQIKAEFALLLFFPVALVAAFAQQRSDVGVEINGASSSDEGEDEGDPSGGEERKTHRELEDVSKRQIVYNLKTRASACGAGKFFLAKQRLWSLGGKSER
jgi:hypothetical protein